MQLFLLKNQLIFNFLIYCLILTFSSNLINSYKPPVIAILGNPDPWDAEEPTTSRVNYFFIRWLEQSRADVVVIQPWATEDQIDELLLKVNGVLWPGGDRNLNLNNQFEKVAKMILEKLIKIFDDKGISIPLWGTCQGFQLMHTLFSNTTQVLKSFPHNNIQSNLIINSTVINETKMYSDFNYYDIFNLQNKNTTAQFHFLGVSEKEYEIYPKLNEIFKITSLGKDTQGNNYISSVEGRKYPFYGVQFHPEMVQYSKTNQEGIPKSLEAIKISELLSNFILKEAKRNNNTMTIEEMKKFDHINLLEHLPVKKNLYYYYLFDKNKKENTLKSYIKNSIK